MSEKPEPATDLAAKIERFSEASEAATPSYWAVKYWKTMADDPALASLPGIVSIVPGFAKGSSPTHLMLDLGDGKTMRDIPREALLDLRQFGIQPASSNEIRRFAAEE